MSYNYIKVPQSGMIAFGLKEKGIEIIELSILNFIHNWSNEKYSIKLFSENRVFVWVNNKLILSMMPAISVNKPGGLKRRVDNLVNVGLIKRHKDNKILGRSYYCITDFGMEVLNHGNKTHELSDEQLAEMHGVSIEDIKEAKASNLGTNVRTPSYKCTNPLSTNVPTKNKVFTSLKKNISPPVAKESKSQSQKVGKIYSTDDVLELFNKEFGTPFKNTPQFHSNMLTIKENYSIDVIKEVLKEIYNSKETTPAKSNPRYVFTFSFFQSVAITIQQTKNAGGW